MDFREIDPEYLYSKNHDDYIDIITTINPLKALMYIDLPSDCPWGYDSPTFEEAKELLKQNPSLEEEPHGNGYENLPGNHLYHIKRIKYFINHPEEIVYNKKNKIKIWLHIKEEGICDEDNFYYEIWDGNHRLYAAAIAEITSVECHFQGSKEFLKMIQ